MSASFHVRVGQYRRRMLIRAWQHRQRNHTHGVWFRLRRVLADAQDAYILTRADATELVAEGYRAEPVGSELAPARLIVFAPAARLARLASARPIIVRLSAELLSAEALGLTRFEIP
jgi:hypothetical protein